MFPSRSRKSESRRSSILKPRKPRQPLQNVNFDSSSNDSSPTATKTKRRVSFAEIKHVKEFCHSTEQGTVWDNTYEEHDSSLKGSFADQNAEVESKENASCAPNNDHVHICSENSSYYSNNTCLVNNQPSIARDGEEDDNTDCDLDFTNPVKSTELLNVSQLGCASLPNKSLTVSKDAASSGIVEYSDTDEECMELFDKKSQPRQTVITSISCMSKNVESNCIAVYRDSDEETYADNVDKYNSKSCSNNINSQLNETHTQDLSMDLTEPIPVFLSSYVKEQKRNDINNFDTNYTTNCHNASMEMTEAVPIFAEPVASDLGIFKQIPTILQNCESTKWDAASIRNTTDVNYANDSMILTSVILPFRDTNICRTNNIGFDTSMEMINVPSKMYKRNACNENMKVKENDLRKDQTDKTEIFNDVPMEMTRPVNILFPNVYNKENFRMDEPSRDDRTMFFHNVSMEMTKAVSTKNKQEIANTNTCRLLSKENAHGEDVNTSVCFNEGTRICKSMEFTEAVPGPLCYETTFHNAHVTQSVNKSTCEDYKKDGTEFFNDASMEITKSVNNMLPLNINKENLKIDESKDGKTMFFHNVSMEMTTAVSSRNRNEITQPVTCKSVFKENTYGGKDTNNSICFNEKTRLLCKSMEFTEVVPNSLNDERTCDTPATQSFQTLSKTTLLPAENSVRVTDAVTNKTVQDISMEITTAVPSISQLKKDVKLNEYKENISGGKDTINSTCFNEATRLLCKSMEFTEVVPISLHDERTFNTTPATQSSQTLSRTTSLSAENSVRITDAVTNKTVQDVSMEITTAVPSISQLKKDVKLNEYKENIYGGKDTINSTCFNEATRLLYKSMEFTEVVPNSLNDERTCDTPATQSFQTLSKTTLLPAENSVRVTDAVTNKTVQDVSMEITTAVPSISQLKKDVKLNEYKENIYGGKDTINSTYFNEATRLLCKSMEFTEVGPNSLHDERTFNTTPTTQSSQILSETTSLPAENSMRIIDVVTNKTVQDVSMEITTAVPSILQLIQNEKLNETENSIISKNDEFQHLTTNNLAKSNRNATKENSTISKEIVETENIRHNELSNVIVTQSSLDNLDNSLNANFKNGNDKKRRSDASEESYSKRVRTSMEIQSFQENDIHPFPNANTNCINDIERPECFVKDIVDHMQLSDSNFVNDIECNQRFIKNTMNHTQVPDSNLRDSFSEINKHSFLRKSLPYLENSFIELQSIKPPSFVCLDSEEENSSHEIQNELQSSIITDTVNNTSNQLINNVTESKCLKEKVINIEKNQVEDCHRNIIVDKTKDNKETNCQTGTKIIINDNQMINPDKSNYCTKKNISKENILSMNEKTLTVQDINHCTSLIIKEIEDTNEIDEDQVNEGEHTQKSTNEDVKLQSDIKEKEQYSDKKNQETKQCSDHFESTEAIIEEIDSEERRTNLNDEVQQQSIEQKNECATKKLETAQHSSTIEDVKNESLIEQDPFLILSQKLETHGARDDCIWDVYHKNIDRKMIVFGFMSNSLLIATFLSYDLNSSEENLIKEIKIISRISDNAGILIRIVHKLILEKLNAEILTKLYKTHQDILPMLNFISQDVKLAMDFMFDLRRLDDLNLMDIDYDEISFVSRSKRMDIILRVTIKVKQFDKLTSNDISLRCLLGRIKETDVKNLIKNVKRDQKFLRRYMNDVKDYIDIMEETSNNLMTE